MIANGKKQSCCPLFLAFLIGILIFISHNLQASTLPSDVLSILNSYNVTWTTPSTNGSPGSMPIGNGDITANVWVENNGGDLMMYIGKSDTWSEGTRLLKVGPRAHPFLAQSVCRPARRSTRRSTFTTGKLTSPPEQPARRFTLRIYIDANQPVIRIEASGQQNFTMSCSNEIWRSSIQPIEQRRFRQFLRGAGRSARPPSESADVAVTSCRPPGLVSSKCQFIFWHALQGREFERICRRLCRSMDQPHFWRDHSGHQLQRGEQPAIAIRFGHQFYGVHLSLHRANPRR